MPAAFAGHYLDGRSAARQPATIRLTATGLDIALESGAALWWPFAEVRQTQGFYAGQQIRLERGAPLAAMLLVDDVGFLAALHTAAPVVTRRFQDRKSTRLNSSHGYISYAVFCLKKKNADHTDHRIEATKVLRH